MRKSLISASSALALSLALAGAPANAQLLGGAVGGAVNLSVGADVAGSLDAPRGLVGETTRTVTRTVAAVPAAPVARIVHTTVAVAPAVPDVVVRREAIIEAGIEPVTVVEAPEYIDRQYVALQDDLRGDGVEVHKRGEQIVIDMPADVTFAFDKYDIQPRFDRVLDAVSRTLARNPATYVDVDGHTDAIGAYAYNQVLSEKRAGAVADYLADRSVNPARMHVEGFGKTEPVASNATVEGRAANRRVEIILTPYTS
jgi:outer membrane protein OmpA-like peptidoglycan-associated protein